MNSKTANHIAAPITAGFVGDMRRAFGKVDVLSVDENSVHIGSVTKVKDLVLVSYGRTRETTNKAGRVIVEQLAPLQYTIGTAV